MTSTATATEAKRSKFSSLGGDQAERRERYAAVRARIADDAATANACQADALALAIEARAANDIRDFDGCTAMRAWMRHTFNFHHRVAADIAAIATSAVKFAALANAAVAGVANIDHVAFAIRRLNASEGMRAYARIPYREAVPSPFDPETLCVDPEALIGEYCAHATFDELAAHLGAIEAAIDNGEEIIDGLSEQTLQHLDIWEHDNGMWGIAGTLSSDTGQMFAKMLRTSVSPLRQDEVDADGSHPAQGGLNAEAVHQLLIRDADNPAAPHRHGHTCSLNLTVDIDTLRGFDTGRVPMLEGRPCSVGKARLLACDAKIIPSVFDYAAGEALELGRAFRLPKTDLRRALELEQLGGCAWAGCDKPTEWLEAHHLAHWADGGATDAGNLILVCRFHHGRAHTPGWTVEKTGPGRAVFTHQPGHADSETDPDLTCGCGADGTHGPAKNTANGGYDTTGLDLNPEDANDTANGGKGSDGASAPDLFVDDDFPTDLLPCEYSPRLKDELDAYAAQLAMQAANAARRSAREYFRATPNAQGVRSAAAATQRPAAEPAPRPTRPRPAPLQPSGPDDPIPFLLGPRMRVRGRRAA